MRKMPSILLIIFIICLSSCSASSISSTVAPTDSTSSPIESSSYVPESSAVSNATVEGPVRLVADPATYNVQWTASSEEIDFSNLDDFAYKTAWKLLKERQDNLNYSPLSFYYAAALAAIGAEGQTESELLGLLEAKSKTQLQRQCKELFKLCCSNESHKFLNANSLWMNEKIGFKESYLKAATDYFQASLYSADFSDPKTAQTMTKWIYDHTLGELSPDMMTSAADMMTIINCLYFSASWRNGPMGEEKRDFYLIPDQAVETDFLRRTINRHPVYEGDNFRRCAVDLASGQMVFVLPDEGIALDELLTDQAALKKLFTTGNKTNYDEVNFKVPSYSFDDTFDLMSLSKSLGIKTPFSTRADFSAMAHQHSFISDITQKTKIEVFDTGVKAVAVTMVINSTCIASKVEDKTVTDFILDRPFLFAITAPDGTILFIGRCVNPAR